MSGTDPGDPFANPGWNTPAGYPEAPPTAPPPWAAPTGPPPMPPTPTPKRGAWPVVVAVVAGIGATLAILGFLASNDDDPRPEEQATEADDDRRSTSTTSTTTPTSTSTATSTTTTTAPLDVSALPAIGGPVVSSGDWSIQLPEGWVGADVAQGIDGAGAQLFPDDPALASQVEVSLQALPRVVRMFGTDESAVRDRAAFVSNLNVLADPSATSGTPIDQLLAQQQRGLEAIGFGTVERSDVVTLGGRPVGRLVIRLDGLPAHILGYVIDTGDEVVVVTYSIADGGLPDAVFDASAATFSAG